MKGFDLQIAFFQPLWRRVVIVSLCFGWALVELITGAPFWAILFGATGVWSTYQFFFVFAPKPADQDTP
jgi:hypothetical protein